MSKYILTIEGDFEKGECESCPVRYFTFNKNGEREEWCPAHISECPLKEVEQGEWKKVWGGYICSKCGNLEESEWDFCSNCGAKMKGGK